MTKPLPIQELIDRIEALIRDDESLTVVETVGALHMIATRLATTALFENDAN